MKVNIVVPIKLNNERFPNKNLEPLGNKPLCTYLLTTLLKVKNVDNIYVYCSDDRIVSYLPKGIKFFRRSSELDQFSVRRQQIVSYMIKDIPSDIYVYAHVTNPFLGQETIERAIKAVKEDGYDTAVGVCEHKKYGWYLGKEMNFDRNNLLRTQDIDPVYLEMGLFVFKKEIAMTNGSVYGEKIKLISVSETEAVDIDYRQDLEFANALLKSQDNKVSE